MEKEKSFAMEILQDYKKANKRLFILLLVILSMWFITIGEFAEEYNKGTYLVTMAGHITVVKDGIVYDTFDCRDRQIWDAWKIKNKCNLVMLTIK